MRIESLILRDFRSYENSRFEFSSFRVLFLGPNGAGKSNLLEAIGYLSVLRSFRGAAPREMVALDKRSFTIGVKLDRNGRRKELAVRETSGGPRELFEDRVPVRRSSEFIGNFRTVVFAPEDRRIVSAGASHRRRFFDMLISVLEPKYFSALGSFNRALKQRNKALRSGGKGAEFFLPEIVECAMVLTAFRREYAVLVEKEVNRLLGSKRFSLTPKFSAPEDPQAFLELLHRETDRELRRGVTLYGPHLDDFEMFLDGKPLRICGSTGQIRLVSLYLKLAEFFLVKQLSELPVLVLADDVTGELDAENTGRFLELTRVADQAFFTFAVRPDNEFFASAQEIVLPRPV